MTLAWSLPGCATSDTPETCRIVQLGAVPIRMEGNLPLLDATVNGQKATLLLDTGAEFDTVNQAAFERLGLEHDYSRPTYTTGLGAQGSDWATRPVAIAMGGITGPSVSMLVARFGAPMRFDGLLGGATLAEYDLDIDMPARRLTFYAARRCPTGPPPFEPSTTLRAEARRTRLMVPVSVDGAGLQPVFDTGASRTIVDQGRLGLSPEAVTGDRTVKMTTADPVGLAARLHRFREMRVGDEVVATPFLMVGDLSRSGTDGLLGSDFWRDRRVWVSYGGRTLTVGPAGRPRK